MRPCAVSLSLAFLFAGLACSGVGAIRLHAQALTQQYARKQVDKGPRALGLVQITDKGKARLIPITIMMEGKFYDAGSYHATPVPMALDFGTVYEGFRTGVSQGIFTITQPGQLSHNWIAEGAWLPAGEKAQERTKKYAAPVIDDNPGKDDHPVLHRRAEGAADKDEAKPAGTAPPVPPSATPPATAPPTGTQPTSTSPASTSKETNTTEATKDTTKAPAQETRKADASDQPISDPNRPVLRRGKPDPNAHHEPFVNFDDPVEAAKAATDAKKEADADAPSVQTVTAISDAGGPDPRPYTYDLKPAEEAIYRNKMFDLAAAQLQAKTKPASQQASSVATAKGAAAKRPSTAKPAKPQLEDVHLRIFDLSSSNEPILVLSARTPLPPISTPGNPVPQEITLIARTNLEGELQKLFFAHTDSRHLDVSPRMELIDAVDADGDGRGELLFRRTSDAGSAYAIYRVTADGLWPLYEGTP